MGGRLTIGRPTEPGNDAWTPDPKTVQGMIDWLNARQEGIERARKKLNAKGCTVYHAAEVNKIQPALDGHTGCIVDLVIQKTTEESLAFGCPYVVCWQLYDNECRMRPAAQNSDCRGFWLIRPDGSKSWAYDYFEKLLKGGR